MVVAEVVVNMKTFIVVSSELEGLHVGLRIGFASGRLLDSINDIKQSAGLQSGYLLYFHACR